MNTLLLAVLLPLAPSAPAAPQGETQATYRITFDATWSSSTHPGAYPSGAHFSGLIGGVHNANVSFWAPGQLASPGIKSMAELGAKFPLTNEINAAIQNGTAREVISGSGIGSPGSTSVVVTLTKDHPRVTLVTMVAPSPDWFLGVHGRSLLQNGQWVDSDVANLFAYDAGTDSGQGFNSPDQVTNPPVPIALITEGPLAGKGKLGTFTFTRLVSTLELGCGVNPAGSLQVDSGSPTIGTTFSVTLHDPTGQLTSPAASFMGLSAFADPNFPCGTLVPRWGLTAQGSDGELLIGPTFQTLWGPPWMGTGARFDMVIPDDPALTGLTFYMQGLLIDANKRRGLTGALQLFMGG
jgi:hypothetical protein